MTIYEHAFNFMWTLVVTLTAIMYYTSTAAGASVLSSPARPTSSGFGGASPFGSVTGIVASTPTQGTPRRRQMYKAKRPVSSPLTASPAFAAFPRKTGNTPQFYNKNAGRSTPKRGRDDSGVADDEPRINRHK